MKMTLEERLKAGLVKLGKKNKIWRPIAIGMLAVCLFFFHIGYYFRNNTKRFSLLAMSFVLFVVYSSFSFPLFISGGDRMSTAFLYDEDSIDVAFGEELWVDPADMELLSEDLTVGDVAHGEEVSDYDADEILEVTGRRGERPSLRETKAAVDVEFSREDWKLVLVNKQHPIPEDYTFELGTIMDDMKCDARIIDDLLDMLQAAREDGVILKIRSPYRTGDRQEYLFNRHMKNYMRRGMSYLEAYQLTFQAVTIPGASEHQIGLALDITCDSYNSLDEGFGDTEAGRWLAENSCKYGFILRYPLGKEYITGIEYEPWHFRYVGVDAATVITQKGITLEEFWEDL